MSRIGKSGLISVASALALLSLPALASAELVVSQVDWETMGASVRFHAQFHNNDPSNASGEVSGGMHSQPFGAFVDNAGPIGTFNVPPLAPNSFFDVFFDISLADLPPSAQMILPGGGPGGLAPGMPKSAQTTCPPANYWNGNVDMFWTGPGGTGNVNYHFSQLLVNPGGGNSCIHVIMDCQDPAGIFWSLSGLCPGWSATLWNDNGSFAPGTPAPNPIPTGFFDGWICVSADVSVPSGGTCSPALNLLCGTQPATINVTSEACDWGAVPVQPSTWGEVKARFGETTRGN